MVQTMLEVIALNATDAEAAQAGGAHRLELTVDMAADGLTPPVPVLRDVLSATDLPVRVMLRDAPGFAPGDLDRLRRDAAALREAGATEFVLGFLDARGRVDEAACAALVEELAGCAWTFHRALDNSVDPEAAWDVVAGLGCDTVLAAGSPGGVAEGFAVLERLAARQGGVRQGDGVGWGGGARQGDGVGQGGLGPGGAGQGEVGHGGGGPGGVGLGGVGRGEVGLGGVGLDGVKHGDAGPGGVGRGGGVRLLVGGGLKVEHVGRLKAVGVTGFHVGGAVRTGGWGGPVSVEAVRGWVGLV